MRCSGSCHQVGRFGSSDFPEAPLDVLAQQIVAACSAREAWDEDEIFALVKRAYPYRNLTRATFKTVLEMLSEGIAAQRGRYGAYLHRDRVNGKLRARRGARLAAITSGGAIPDNSLYTVVAEPDGLVVGTVDEDFAVEERGDIMLLGNTSWMIRRIERQAACSYKMRTAPRPACLSGVAKLRRARGTVRARRHSCGKRSANCCRVLRPWDSRQLSRRLQPR